MPPAPILIDGFLLAEEMAALERDGAVGELTSRFFDGAGVPIDNDVTRRMTSLPLRINPRGPVVLAAAGPAKVKPIIAALKGGFASGLITDEWTAAVLLEQGSAGAEGRTQGRHAKSA